MKLTQIRNATLRLDYAGVRFLVDPMFAAKGSIPAFAGTPHQHLRNPTVDLPVDVERLLEVDAVIVTHLHDDHWDEAAIAVIPRTLPIFVQDEPDALAVRTRGFRDVRIMMGATRFLGVGLARTDGQHGSDAVMARVGPRMGRVSGFVLCHEEEPTLYVAGDTVWNRHVRAALDRHRPAVIVANCGDARIDDAGAIIMDADDFLSLAHAAPGAILVASHLEALNHCVLSRGELARRVAAAGMSGRVRIPADGETLLL